MYFTLVGAGAKQNPSHYLHWAKSNRSSPGHVFLGERNGVLGHHRLPGRRVRSHKHRVVSLEPQDGLLLEHVQLEGPLGRQQTEGRKMRVAAAGWLFSLTMTRAGSTQTRGQGQAYLKCWVRNAFGEIIAGRTYVYRHGPFFFFLYILFGLLIFFFFLFECRGRCGLLSTENNGRYTNRSCVLRGNIDFCVLRIKYRVTSVGWTETRSNLDAKVFQAVGSR